MTIELSHSDLALLCNEVTTASGTLQGIWYTSQSTWLFQTRGSGETHLFVVSCDPRWSRLHLVDRKEADARTPDSLTMLMRKWLLPSQFVSATVDTHDRLVTLVFKSADAVFQLHLEVAERWANLTLVRDGVVVGCHVTNARVRIHRAWTLPETVRVSPIQDRLPALEPSKALADEVALHMRAAVEAEVASKAASALDDALKRMRRREKAVTKDLAKIENAEELRRKGELLKTLHGRVPAGATVVRVVDYWDPDLREVEVQLDPTRSLQANDRAFHGIDG
ncbi:MAG: NFACT family protein [bacterium]